MDDAASLVQRAVNIWSNICAYVHAVGNCPRFNRPTSAFYGAVVKTVNDNLTIAKLHTFIAFAKWFTAFLSLTAVPWKTISDKFQTMVAILKGLLSKISNFKLVSATNWVDLIKEYVHGLHLFCLGVTLIWVQRVQLPLDKFLKAFISEKAEFAQLWYLIKLMLIHLHGQAREYEGKHNQWHPDFQHHLAHYAQD